MVSFVFRKIDPRPAEVEAALAQVIANGLRDLANCGVPLPPQFDYPDWDDLLAATEEPEGVHVQHWILSWRHPPGVVVGVAWWTDALGRKHWFLESALANQPSSFYQEVGGAYGVDLTAGRHPLEWHLPVQACGWRERGGVREFVTMCGCGVVGPPAAVAWAGECCGPCFDMQQDGLMPSSLPPARPHLGMVSSFAFAPDGRLLTVARLAEGDPGAGSIVKVWEAPWTSSVPLWSQRFPQNLRVRPVCGERAVVLADGEGFVAILDLVSGQPVETLEGEEYAGLEGLAYMERAVTLVGMYGHYRGPGDLLLWRWDGAGNLGPLLLRRPVRGRGLAAQASGVRVALQGTRQGLEVREVVRGGLVEHLDLPAAGHLSNTVFTPEGAILAVQDRYPPSTDLLLARWEPGPVAGIRTGLSGWLAQQGGRPPSLWKDLDLDGSIRLQVAPDGQVLAGTAEHLVVFWDARTLEELARFSPPGAALGALAFSPDGQSLLVETGGRIAVWPWRELLGPRQVVRQSVPASVAS